MAIYAIFCHFLTLRAIHVPLIYVRYVDPPMLLRFYTPDDKEEVFYNLFTQKGWPELEGFLKKHCL